MKRFTTLILTIAICFGVLAPVAISVAPSGVAIQSSVVSAATATTTEDASTQLWNNISCGVGFWGDGSLAGCIAAILYFIPYWVGGELLSLSARFFDITAAYTLSSSLISSSSFVRDGWRTTRDFANVFFIFILLYIAVSLVLGLGSKDTNPKKMIISVVIVALMINFSLFFTEVVIDLSNTTALVFYNQIKVNQTSMDPAVAELSAVAPDVKPKGLSESIAQAFRPHTLQSPEFYKALQDKDSGQVPAGRLIVILLSIGAMYVAAAVAFFVSALSFMGRLIQFWLLIIFAPFALVTYIVPALRKNEKLGFLSWSNWVGSLMSTAVAAPIFFFFLFLISVLAQSALFTGFTTSFSTAGAANSGNWISLMLEILIPTVMIFTMLTMATKYAKKASGTLGELAVKGGMMALGAAGGIALAGVATGGAYAGRNTLGFVGKKLANSKYLNDKALDGDDGVADRIRRGLAQRTLNIGNTAAKSSFLIPSNKVGGLASKGLGLAGLEGLSVAAPASVIAANKVFSKGGYEGALKRKQERKDKRDKQREEFEKKEQEKYNAQIAKLKQDVKDTEVSSNVKQLEADVTRYQQDSDLLAKANKKAIAVQQMLAQSQADDKSGKNIVNINTGVSAATAKLQADLADAKKEAGDIQAKITTTYQGKSLSSFVQDARDARKQVTDIEKQLAQVEKAADLSKINRKNKAALRDMQKTGYKVVGTVTDNNGNTIHPGYLDKTQARSWAASVKMGMAKGLYGAVKGFAGGAIVGSALPGVGTLGVGLAGAGAGFLSAFKNEVAATADVRILKNGSTKLSNWVKGLGQTIANNQASAMGGNPLSGGGARSGTSSTGGTGGSGSGASGSSGGTSSAGASQGQTQNQTAGATTP